MTECKSQFVQPAVKCKILFASQHFTAFVYAIDKYKQEAMRGFERISSHKKMQNQIKKLEAQLTKIKKQNVFADLSAALILLIADELDFASALPLYDELRKERRRMRRALSKEESWVPKSDEDAMTMTKQHAGVCVYLTHALVLGKLKEWAIDMKEFDAWHNIRLDRNLDTHHSLFIGDALSYSRVHELEQLYDGKKIFMSFDKDAKALFKVLYARAHVK